MAQQVIHGVSLSEALKVTGTAIQYGHGIGLFWFKVEKHGDTYTAECRLEGGEVNWREEGLTTLTDVKLHIATNIFDNTLPNDWWPANADEEPLGWSIYPDGTWEWSVPEPDDGMLTISTNEVNG